MKRRNIWIWLVCIILIVVAGIAAIWWTLHKDDEIRNSINVTFKTDEAILEYGEKKEAKDLINDMNGTIKQYPNIDTKTIGKQELTFVVEKEGFSKEFKYTVEVKDTKGAEITFAQDTYEIQVGDDFTPDQLQISVSDPVDGKLKESKELKNGVYILRHNVDTGTVGEYECSIKAKDRNGNETKKSVKIIVKAKESPVNQTVQPTYVNGILLVNKSHPVPKDFGGMDNTAYSALMDLQVGAGMAGYSIQMLSGYRSYEYQAQLYQSYVNRDGQEKADTYSARPGYSEHQTGLAFDVGQLDYGYGNTPEGKWLYEHAHEYGFIIRYQKGKEHITGYTYEPWHIRYVVVKVASEIYQKGISLEEYLGVD